MPGGRVTRFTYDSNAISYFNSSYQSGKAPSPDAPRIEDVAAEALALCKDFGKKALQVSAKIYVEYKSFENGVTAAVIRNLGQPGTDLFGALESLITGKTTIANRMQSSLNAKIHSYEQNSYDKTMFSVGMVTGDVAGIAADILLAIYGGGISAGMKVAAQGKDALVLVSEGVALGKFVEAGALVDAIKNGTNLGNDLSNLFSQIKGGSDSDLGNYKFKEGIDEDLRGGKGTFEEALEEAFEKTGTPKEDFVVTKWGKDQYGKSHPVEWRASNGAEVSVDIGHSMQSGAPTADHVGWHTGGKRSSGGGVRGHIFVDEVPYNR